MRKVTREEMVAYVEQTVKSYYSSLYDRMTPAFDRHESMIREQNKQIDLLCNYLGVEIKTIPEQLPKMMVVKKEKAKK